MFIFEFFYLHQPSQRQTVLSSPFVSVSHGYNYKKKQQKHKFHQCQLQCEIKNKPHCLFFKVKKNHIQRTV